VTADDIQEGLSLLVKDYCLALLPPQEGAPPNSRAAGAVAPQRAAAIALLKRELAPGGCLVPSSPQREATLAAAYPHLSAAELVSVYEGLAGPVPCGEEYEVALALLTHGVASVAPDAVVQANWRFNRLQGAGPRDACVCKGC
jgi:hypothetical protein